MKKSYFVNGILFVSFLLVGGILTILFLNYINSKKRASVVTKVNGTPFPTSGYTIENPPSQSLNGKVVSMEGDVKWQSRTATESSSIKELIPIKQGESLKTGDKSMAKVLFDEDLQINLNEKSSVNFIQTLPLSLVMRQESGSIDYQKLGNLPVSIRIKHLLVDLNGSVLVTVNQEKPTITLLQKDGSSTLAFNDLNFKSQIITLESGKTLVFNDSTRKVVLK